MRAKPECRLQCLALRFGKSTQAVQRRAEKLVQPGERKLRLGLDAVRAENREAELLCSFHGRREQDRLANPRVAAHRERAAMVGELVDNSIEPR